VTDVQFDLANQVLFIAMIGVSLNLVLGYAGQVSVAQASFAGVAAYTAARLAIGQEWGFWPCLAAGVAAAFLCGALIALPAVRLGVQQLILLTLAAAFVLYQLTFTIPALGGSYGLLGVPPLELFGKEFFYARDWFWVWLAFGAVVFLIYWRLGESPYGRVLKAIREDEGALRALGKDPFPYKVQVFAVTSGLAGVAGVLLTFYQQLVSPQQYAVSASLLAVTVVIFGGSGNLYGPIVGAIAIVIAVPVLEEVLDLDPTKASLVRLMVYGVALIFLVRLRPQGIVPEGVGLRSAARRLRELAGRPPPASDARSAAPPEPVPLGPLQGDAPAVEARGLQKRFGGVVAADGVDFVLPAGEITGLMGPNGAGKTVLFGILTGHVMPDAGQVELLGRETTGLSADNVTRLGMARSFQDVRLFYRLSVLDNVMLAMAAHPGETIRGLFLGPVASRRFERSGRQRAMSYLAFVGLADRADALAGQLSFGQQKLLSMARLLATEARVMLLDEPAAGIHPQRVEEIIGVVRRLPELGRTVCVIEHDLHALRRLADRCYFMEDGRITGEGSFESLVNDPRLKRAYFGGGQVAASRT
jgi:branched-chain amino acid transport system permease protein